MSSTKIPSLDVSPSQRYHQLYLQIFQQEYQHQHQKNDLLRNMHSFIVNSQSLCQECEITSSSRNKYSKQERSYNCDGVITSNFQMCTQYRILNNMDWAVNRIWTIHAEIHPSADQAISPKMVTLK